MYVHKRVSYKHKILLYPVIYPTQNTAMKYLWQAKQKMSV